jgi:hypothetical protein
LRGGLSQQQGWERAQVVRPQVDAHITVAEYAYLFLNAKAPADPLPSATASLYP